MSKDVEGKIQKDTKRGKERRETDGETDIDTERQRRQRGD